MFCRVHPGGGGRSTLFSLGKYLRIFVVWNFFEFVDVIRSHSLFLVGVGRGCPC